MVHGRICVDIPESVKKHPTLISQILAIHTTYGSSQLWYWQEKGLDLDFLGVINAPWDDVEKEATHFIVTAYGGLGVTMSECRKQL